MLETNFALNVTLEPEKTVKTIWLRPWVLPSIHCDQSQAGLQGALANVFPPANGDLFAVCMP